MGAPGLHGSGHTPVDPDHAAETAEHRSFEVVDDAPAPVPEENQPGHRPAVEQDKPSPAALHTASLRARVAGTSRFPFAFDGPLGVLSRAAGAHPDRSGVELTEGTLVVRYGPWSLETDLTNVATASVTGPYQWWKVAGPPRLSFADRGITFATNAERGVCIRFHDPVPAALPTAILRHPGVTVTVADPEALVEALSASAEAARELADGG